MAALVHRCEALVDGRKVNEAVDLLNQLGKPYQYHTILCTILFTHAREESEFYLVHTVQHPTHTHTHSVDRQLEEEEGREEAVKVKEQAILLLGKTLAKHGFAEGTYVKHFCNNIREFNPQTHNTVVLEQSWLSWWSALEK